MPALETMVTSSFILTGILIALAIVFRSFRQKASQKRIGELEDELLQSHKEILELEKQLAQRINTSTAHPRVVALVPEQEKTQQQKKAN